MDIWDWGSCAEMVCHFSARGRGVEQSTFLKGAAAVPSSQSPSCGYVSLESRVIIITVLVLAVIDVC